MSKYKIGDVIKLRDDLEDEQEFDIIAGTFVVDEDVLDLKNTPLKIVDYKNKHGFYIVEFEENKKGKICDGMIQGLWGESKSEGKLKLIDVLNMIAKGELKEGTKVKWRKMKYIFEDGELERKVNEETVNIFEDMYCINLNDDEVELIEPPCEHEWENYEIHRIGEGRIIRFRRCNRCGLEEETEDNHFADDGKTSEPAKIEELDKEEMLWLTQQCVIAVLTDKLNEVIRVINKE